MADVIKPISVDGEGYEVLTRAVLELLDQYASMIDREILFEELGKDSGMAFSADNGALVMTERKTITGKISQTCQYPFMVIYRTTSTNEKQKLRVQEILDSLGKWICKESAVVNGRVERLQEYPPLSDNRKIIRVTRQNSYATEPDANGVQDWVLPVTVQYTNEIHPD